MAQYNPQAILDDIYRSKMFQEPRKTSSNWASKCGHPCERYLVYNRLNWQDKEVAGPEKQILFDAGDLYEEFAKKKLRDAGYKCIRDQSPITSLDDYNVGGYIDWMVQFSDDRDDIAVTECKGLSMFTWNTLRTVQDMKNHRYHYVRLYPDQLNIYMHGIGVYRGFFFLINKNSIQFRVIDVPYDEERALEVLDKLARVNTLVDNKEYPDRCEFDEVWCGSCDFKHICMPPELTGEGLEFIRNEQLYDALLERQSLRDGHNEYNRHDKLVKSILIPGKEQVVIGDKGQFTITWKKQKNGWRKTIIFTPTD